MVDQLFLSSIDLADVPSLPSGLNIADRASLHRFVMSLFGDVPDRNYPRSSAHILFRSETLRHRRRLLVQSSVKPLTDIKIRTIEVAPLVQLVCTHPRFGLKVDLNPVQRVPRSGRDRVVPNDQLEDWTRSKLKPGFNVERFVDLQFSLARVGQSRLAVVSVDAQVSIADSSAALEMLTNGLGRRKSHGCGLISLAPLAV